MKWIKAFFKKWLAWIPWAKKNNKRVSGKDINPKDIKGLISTYINSTTYSSISRDNIDMLSEFDHKLLSKYLAHKFGSLATKLLFYHTKIIKADYRSTTNLTHRYIRAFHRGDAKNYDGIMYSTYMSTRLQYLMDILKDWYENGLNVKTALNMLPFIITTGRVDRRTVIIPTELINRYPKLYTSELMTYLNCTNIKRSIEVALLDLKVLDDTIKYAFSGGVVGQKSKYTNIYLNARLKDQAYGMFKFYDNLFTYVAIITLIKWYSSTGNKPTLTTKERDRIEELARVLQIPKHNRY